MIQQALRRCVRGDGDHKRLIVMKYEVIEPARDFDPAKLRLVEVCYVDGDALRRRHERRQRHQRRMCRKKRRGWA